ncbi:MAG TPA: Kdo hydroxylase family protein [Noviherbaspirillum sp.]|uniref:Kdo hydroxylase family protein n=1 Tax=Noviherbaspirillum sp. TaxID=1926288 RepID=UPI002F940776
MEAQILEIDATEWQLPATRKEWIAALEAGKVLYFPRLAFQPDAAERALMKPELLATGIRSITLEAQGRLKGVNGGPDEQAVVMRMMARFRHQAEQLIASLVPDYMKSIRFATTSYRPLQVETRQQTWRGDDKRLHVDAFAGRPNHGERILRVFANVNPDGVPRVWRVGEPFEDAARRFMPRMEKYRRWHALYLRAMYKTKKVRSEYDHLMLQLHDAMKLDMEYQKTSPQVTMPFPAGSVWVCFSDQTTHAAMSGQHMMEQTLHLPPECQYDPASSPLGILTRIVGHELV